MEKPDKTTLQKMYCSDRISPAAIAERFGVTQRSIYNWFKSYNIASVGPSHLRKGKSATWNVGIVRTSAQREQNRIAHLGVVPQNYGVGRIKFSCEVCGADVFDKPYRRKRVCSKECRDKLHNLLRGKLHWNYSSREPVSIQKTRMWAEFREWRKSILSLHGYTCAKCGVIGGKLTAHHLFNWAEYPEKRLDLENGVAMCWKCHRAFHRTCGYKHTTEIMFRHWLTTY